MMAIFFWMTSLINKTAGCQQHIFRPLILLKLPFHTFTDFEKQVFSKKLIYFFQKRINLIFEKYYFSRILRQICYNLEIKNQFLNLGILPGQLAGKRKKTHRFEWLIFPPIINVGGE